MQEESPQELLGSDGHQSRLPFLRVVLPSKRDIAISEVHDAVIRNSNAMRVASQILKDMLGPSEWRFGVDNPVLAEQHPKQPIEVVNPGK